MQYRILAWRRDITTIPLCTFEADSDESAAPRFQRACEEESNKGYDLCMVKVVQAEVTTSVVTSNASERAASL